MKKKFRTQKGFTLIELIIVLAIFAIIMTLVMSYVDPVSKLMGRSSMREKTASYVDNIDEYVQKSLRYSSYVRIFESDFAETKSPYKPTSEETAVRDFVDDFYDGAVNNKGEKITGKVHVLKLCNESNVSGITDCAATPAGKTIKPGTIIEDVYDFTAGDSKPLKPEVDGLGKNIPKREFDDSNGFPHAVISNKTTTLAVNPEHLESFSYFYALGYNTFDPVCEDYTNSGANAYSSDDAKNLYGLPVDSKYYYNELHTAKDNDGNDITIGKDSFAVTVVAYQNDKKGCNMITANKKISATDTVPVTVFRSPSYMSAVSMSFPNLYSTTINETCVCKVQEEDTGTDKNEYSYVTVWDQAFSSYTAVPTDPLDPTTNNIYFIFIVPSEIY